MANRVFKISDTNEKHDEQVLEVYRDISMVSERKLTTFIEREADKPKRVQRQTFYATKDVNVKAVFNSLRNIFSWIPGERILNPEFGSKLRLYLYDGITPENKEQIAAEIRGVCLKWEPRVNIVSIHPANDVRLDEDNTVQLDIIFTIPSLSDKQYQYSYIYDRTR